MKMFFRIALLACFTFHLLPAQASDLAKEKRWADQVVDTIVDGEAVWLNDGNHDFLAIYTEAQEDRQRAAIIMHGTGAHPNWQQVVYPLRVGLTEHGWNTLSIQMPILDNEAKIEDYAALYPGEVPARFTAAMAYLKKMGMKHIVLIGHSQGPLMGAYYLSRQSDDIDAFVAISMRCDMTNDEMNTPLSLRHIHMPVLALYGSDDEKDVLNSKSLCESAAKSAGNEDYTQKTINGANHFYDGKDDELVEVVANWLDKVSEK